MLNLPSSTGVDYVTPLFYMFHSYMTQQLQMLESKGHGVLLVVMAHSQSMLLMPTNVYWNLSLNKC
jgi:hypothetical protein